MYCSCGTRIDFSKERCDCGMKVPQDTRETSSTTPQAHKKNDRWHKKYCTPPSSASSSRQATPTGPILRSTPTNLRPLSSSAASTSSSSLPLLDKILPPLPPLAHQPTTATRIESPPSTSYQPIIPTNTGSSISSLTKVFGSVLEQRIPEAARCLGCNGAFGKIVGGGGTIYPADGYDPASPDARFLCLPCFTKTHSKGDCQSCCKPVLGIKGDPMMENLGQRWHERCFVCATCNNKATLISLESLPTCETCFFSPPPPPTTAPSKQSSQRASPLPSSFSRPKSNLGGLSVTPTNSSNVKSRPRSSFMPSSASPTNSRAGPSVSDLASRFTYQPPSNPADSPRHPLQSPSTRRLEVRDNPVSTQLRPSFLRDTSRKISSSSTRPSTMHDLVLPRSGSDLSVFSSSGGESDATSGGTFSDVWNSKDSGLDQLAGGSSRGVAVADRRELELEDLMMEVERGCKMADDDSPRPARVIPTDDLNSTVRSRSKPYLPQQQQRQQQPAPKPRNPSNSIARKAVPLQSPSSTNNNNPTTTAPPPAPQPATKSSKNSSMAPPPAPLPFTGRANLTKAYPSASSPASNIYAKGKTLPRLGGMLRCGGCFKTVAVMERGVVGGPSSSRWHKACLACGGGEGRGPQKLRLRELAVVGCGRQLDEAAKLDSDGGVWCRGCVDTSRRLLRPLTVTLTGNALLASSTSRAPTPNFSSTRPSSMYLPSALSRTMTGPPTTTSRPILLASTRTNPVQNSPPTSSLSKSTFTRPNPPAPINTTAAPNPIMSHLREYPKTALPRPRSILSTNFSEDPRPLSHARTNSNASSTSLNSTGCLSQHHTGSSVGAASAGSGFGHARKGSLKYSAARVAGWRDEGWGAATEKKREDVVPEIAVPVDATRSKRVTFEGTAGLAKRGSILERAGAKGRGGGKM